MSTRASSNAASRILATLTAGLLACAHAQRRSDQGTMPSAVENPRPTIGHAAAVASTPIAPPASPAPMPPSRVDETARAIRQLGDTIARRESDGCDTEAPVAIRRATRAYLEAVLRDDVPTSESSGAAISYALTAPLARACAAGSSSASPDHVRGTGCGPLTIVSADRPRDAPWWLVVRAIESTPVGDDSALYVFAERNNTWTMLLADESTPSCDGERWARWRRADLEYEVVDSDDEHQAYLVVWDVPADPGGRYRPFFEYRVLGTSDDPLQPHVHVSDHGGMLEVDGLATRAWARRDGFDIQSVEETIEHVRGEGSYRRSCDRIDHFVIHEGRVTRGRPTVLRQTCSSS